MSRRWEHTPRNPVPSLLKSLLEDHLDPGYAAAAADRDTGHPTTATRARTWLTVGLVITGLVLGVAFAHNRDNDPGTDDTRAEILATLTDADARIDSAVAERDRLTAAVAEQRAALVADDAQGAATLTALAAADDAAATTAVHGPGVTVTLTDPAARPNLSDPSQRPGHRSATILDRDLQSVVNALWAGGAEAIAVGGVRIGPGVTIRQAGGAMLVDNQPVFSPYVVDAVGPTARMHTDFVVSDAYLRLSGIQQLYGVGFTITEDAELELPAAPARIVESARETETR